MIEDAIPEISEEQILQRVKRLKIILLKEKEDILEEISKEINSFMAKKNNYHGEGNSEQAFESLNLFFKACENLLNVYFPMITDQNFLALQTQHQIMSKIAELKSSVKKNLKALFDKNKISKYEWIKQIQRKTKLQSNPKRGKNSKTSIQSTQVLIKWLLRNFKNPYPTTAQKQQLAELSSLNVSQVGNWFINARERVIKKYLKKDIRELTEEKRKNGRMSDFSEEL